MTTGPANHDPDARDGDSGSPPGSSPTPVEPHFWVSDLEATRRFYTGTLGFAVRQRFPESGSMTWCSLSRDAARIMLAAVPDPAQATGTQAYGIEAARRVGRPGPCSIYIHAADVDALHARAEADPAATVVEPLWDTWWGLRQFTVADPDGNWLTFHRPRD